MVSGAQDSSPTNPDHSRSNNPQTSTHTTEGELPEGLANRRVLRRAHSPGSGPSIVSSLFSGGRRSDGVPDDRASGNKFVLNFGCWLVAPVLAEIHPCPESNSDSRDASLLALTPVITQLTRNEVLHPATT